MILMLGYQKNEAKTITSAIKLGQVFEKRRQTIHFISFSAFLFLITIQTLIKRPRLAPKY